MIDEDTSRDEQLSPGARWVVDEARAASPRIDWARVEAKLFDAQGNVRDDRPSSSGVRAAVAAGFAVAASFVIAFASPPSRGVPPAVSAHHDVQASVVFERDGSSQTLHPGEVISTGKNGGSLHADGRLDVRLAPETQLAMMDDGERILLRLDHGSLAAEVVPVKGGEPFAVDAAGLRVAVHGTRLYVARVDGALQVAVSEGSAVVGTPHADQRTEGPVVCAGCIGRFLGSASIVRDPVAADRLVEDGLHPIVATAATPEMPTVITAPPLPTTVLPTPPTTTTKPLSTNGQPPTVAVAPTTTDVAPPPPPLPGLSPAQYAPTLNKIASALSICAPRTNAGVKVTIHTTLTVAVAPDGSIESVSFDDDPVDTPVRNCALKAMAGVKFPAAPGKTTASKSIVLGEK